MNERPTATLSALGEEGVLVRFGDGKTTHPAAAIRFGNKVRAAGLAGVTEVATALASVLVRFTVGEVDRKSLEQSLKSLLETTGPDENPARGRLWTIPVAFGGDRGPQLAEAATHAGLRVRDAIAEITAQKMQVLAIGFAPGQPYLGHLPERWNIPRQTELTPQVPAGALVVAIRQLVLFANPSPTGWRWVGTCAFRPFKADRRVPFALQAGDWVRLAASDSGTIADLQQRQDGLGGAVLESET